MVIVIGKRKEEEEEEMERLPPIKHFWPVWVWECVRVCVAWKGFYKRPGNGEYNNGSGHFLRLWGHFPGKLNRLL